MISGMAGKFCPVLTFVAGASARFLTDALRFLPVKVAGGKFDGGADAGWCSDSEGIEGTCLADAGMLW